MTRTPDIWGPGLSECFGLTGPIYRESGSPNPTAVARGVTGGGAAPDAVWRSSPDANINRTGGRELLSWHVVCLSGIGAGHGVTSRKVNVSLQLNLGMVSPVRLTLMENFLKNLMQAAKTRTVRYRLFVLSNTRPCSSVQAPATALAGGRGGPVSRSRSPRFEMRNSMDRSR